MRLARPDIFTEEGELVTVWGEVGGELGQLRYPYDVAVNADGVVFLCEYGNNRIQWFDMEGKPLGSVGRAGREPGEFATPWGLALGADGNLWIADTNNHRVQALNWNKAPTVTGVAATQLRRSGSGS